jgi:archaellum component FlaC
MDLDLERIFTTKGSDRNSNLNTLKKEQPNNRNVIKLQPEGQEKNNQINNIQNEAIKYKPKSEKKKDTFDEITLQDKKIIEEKISNNSSAIKEIEERLDSVSEDVDDLVSLYEIVTVEMNPFVGLSKITRKRLDALENMDKDFAELKTRLEDLERKPRTVTSAPTSTVNAIATNTSEGNKVFYSGIDKIIDDAVKYILKGKEIDEIISSFIRDLKVNNNVTT